MDDDSVTDARCNAAGSAGAPPAVPPWKQAIWAAADEAFDANPGDTPGPETAAWFRRAFYRGSASGRPVE